MVAKAFHNQKRNFTHGGRFTTATSWFHKTQILKR
jgi:hypothetical protein